MTISSSPRPALARVRRIMFALLLLSLAAGLFVPVYTDEVAWRFQLSRFLQDGGVDRAVGESCGLNTIAVPPLFMWPVRIFSSAVTEVVDTPLGVRLAGIGFAILGVLGLRRLVHLLIEPGRQRDTMELFAYAMLGMGVLPFLLIWSRPEQPLWLALLGSLLVAATPPRVTEAPRLAMRLAGVTLLALVALCYHPKAVFYLPAFVGLLFVAPPFGRRLAPRLLAGAVVGAAGAVAYGYWSHRLACPADPVLAAKLAKENAAMLFIGGGGWRSLVAALPRLAADMLPALYVQNAGPMPSFMSGWLPPAPLPTLVLDLWMIVYEAGWAAALLLGGILVARAIRDPDRSSARLLAGAALLASSLALAMFQLNKAAYESSLYLPVLLAAMMLCWSASRQHGRSWERVALGLAALSFASQSLLLGAFVPKLWNGERAGGYIAEQPNSLSAFAYRSDAIAAAGARCGLAPQSRPRRVVVDDLTYFAYSRSDMPLHHMGVIGMWRGSIDDPYAWMRSHGSSGAVLACDKLPPDMRRRATASGPFCCLSSR